MRLFHGDYYPPYKEARQLIHKQPVSIAANNENGQFIGWRALVSTR